MVAQRAFGLGVRGVGRLPGLRVRLALVVAFAGLLDPFQFGFQLGDGVGALGAVSFGLLEVVADDEPHVGVVEPDFLDP